MGTVAPLTAVQGNVDVNLIRVESAATAARMEQAKQNAAALSVTDEESFALAEQWTREVLAARDSLEEKLDAWTKPLKELIKLAQRDVKPRLEVASEIVGLLKGKCVGFRADVARRRLDAEREAQRLLAAQTPAPVVEVRAALTAVAEAVAPKSAGITYRDHWVGEVFSFERLPAEFKRLVVDQGKIDDAVKAGTREIPGVLIENRPIMTVRR